MQPDKTDNGKKVGDEKDEEKEKGKEDKEDNEDEKALTAKERYDKQHPTISLRVSERAREKLERYKKEDMTWADVVKKGLEYAEKDADRQHVIQVIKEIITDTITEEMERVLQKNRAHLGGAPAGAQPGNNEKDTRRPFP